MERTIAALRSSVNAIAHILVGQAGGQLTNGEDGLKGLKDADCG